MANRIAGALLAAATLTCFGWTSVELEAEEAKPAQKDRRPAIRTNADARQIVLLIRSTFATVHQANISGNYSVFRDLAAPSLRASMSLVRLGDYFKPLREAKADLSRALLTMPKFSKKPVILKDKFLFLKGYFPGGDNRINFNLTYQRVRGRWRFVNVVIKPKPTAEPSAASELHKLSRHEPPPLPEPKHVERSETAPAAASTDSVAQSTTIGKTGKITDHPPTDNWPLSLWYFLPGRELQ